MTKVASEDSLRRGLERIEAQAGASWLHGHLEDTVRPLLGEPWVLDCDTAIKPLYGYREGAVVSYNPKKPGRPSHACHAFPMAGTRLVLDVVVAPGNRHRSKSAAPSLWALLGRLGREHWPRLVRGDKDWGSEADMASCEGAGLDHLFKLRLTKGARRLASRSMARDEGGFTTQDLKRCRHMARLIALIYNWWSLFVRLADPDRHREAITGFFQTLVRSAEQLSAEERWRRILAQALKKYLRGRQPGRQPWLPPPRAAPAG